jgi:hypothetical protein
VASQHYPEATVILTAVFILEDIKVFFGAIPRITLNMPGDELYSTTMLE